MNALVVSLAPSLDRYLWAPSGVLGTIIRPSHVQEVAGGKGANLARAFATLVPDSEVLLTGCVGGHTGDAFRADGSQPNLRIETFNCASTTRCCTVLVTKDPPGLVQFYEEANPIEDAEWASWCESIGDLVDSSDPSYIAVSGRLEQLTTLSAARDRIRLLWEALGRNGRRVDAYVDMEGVALRSVLEEQPFVVKVNAAEVGQLLGMTVDTIGKAAQGARELILRGAANAIVTVGDRGAVAVVDDELVQVGAGPVGDFPVGSGDCFLAGLIAARGAAGSTWAEALQYATAAGAVNAAEAGPSTLTRTGVHDVSSRVPIETSGANSDQGIPTVLSNPKSSRTSGHRPTSTNGNGQL